MVFSLLPSPRKNTGGKKQVVVAESQKVKSTSPSPSFPSNLSDQHRIRGEGRKNGANKMEEEEGKKSTLNSLVENNFC